MTRKSGLSHFSPHYATHSNQPQSILFFVIVLVVASSCATTGTSYRSRAGTTAAPQTGRSSEYADCAVEKDYAPKQYHIDRQFIFTHDEVDILAPVWWGGNIYEDVQLYDKCLERFTRPQRLMWAVLWYMSEVSNGGHDQFYWNSTGIVWPDVVEGLNALTIPEAASILTEANGRLGGSVPRDRSARQALLDRIKPTFEDLDERLFSLDKRFNVSSRILDYIRAKPDAFIFDGIIAVPPSELNRNRKAEETEFLQELQSIPKQ